MYFATRPRPALTAVLLDDHFFISFQHPNLFFYLEISLLNMPSMIQMDTLKCRKSQLPDTGYFISHGHQATAIYVSLYSIPFCGQTTNLNFSAVSNHVSLCIPPEMHLARLVLWIPEDHLSGWWSCTIVDGLMFGPGGRSCNGLAV